MKKLSKLLKRLEKIATQRNLAIHTIFGLSAFDSETGQWGMTVVSALTPAPDKRLEKDFTAEFRRLESDLGAIYRDLENWLVFTPFPERQWGAPAFAGDMPGYTPPPTGPSFDIDGIDGAGWVAEEAAPTFGN